MEEGTMGVLSWIIVGLMAGWVDSIVVRGNSYGVFDDIILGIAGGLAGGLLAGFVFGVQSPVSNFSLITVALAAICSVVFVFFIREHRGRTTTV
jgi:uncharacterized membrane protein YeaQ/YmgE (transglycosylase-associated protein family)